jgi:hypothetical protein
MNKTALVFFILLLVPASCFIAGCSSLPFSGAPAETSGKAITSGNAAVNAGLAGMDKSSVSQRFPFDEALGTIQSADMAGKWNDAPVNNSGENASGGYIFPEKQITMITGKDIDEKGDAASWSFIVEHGGKVSIATYGRQGLFISDSPGSFKGTIIAIDKIMTPPKLVEKNRAAMFNSSWTDKIRSRDLSLFGDTYSMTTYGGDTPRILTFDAKTGVLIFSNE